MPYFSNMPTFDYPLVVNGKTKFINARNILVRAKFIDYIKNTQSAYLDYTIKDGEKPETLAHRVYGQSDLHWMILLFNEVIDPLFQWPLTSHDLEREVAKKYSGKAIFIDLKRVKYAKNGILVTNSQKEVWYEIGSTITQQVSPTVKARGKVIWWDPNLYKIVVEQTSTANFRVTPDIGNPTSTIADLEHERTDGVTVIAPVGRVVDDNRYAVHHFENADTGEIVDHHKEIRVANGSIVKSSILAYYAVYGQEFLRLETGDFISVDNFKYETDQNELRRNIKMMRPELIDVVVKDMRKIFVG